jgi:hypothetical protein
MKFWLALLLAFLRPAVDDPVDPPSDQNDPPQDDATDLEDLDATDPDPDPKDEPNADLEAARKEARENKERAEKFEREAAELRVRHAPRQDDVTAQEDAKLADPKTPDLEKWQIQANRTLRSNTNAAQMALAQAHDVADRTAFASIAMTDPTAKKYEARVEQELAKARASGQNPSREGLYTYLLGKDMREGKFKKKAAPPGDKPSSNVNRGKLPGARSDVSGKGAPKSEHEKRRARLQDQQI